LLDRIDSSLDRLPQAIRLSVLSQFQELGIDGMWRLGDCQAGFTLKDVTTNQLQQHGSSM
jgi:hypothetical protein